MRTTFSFCPQSNFEVILSNEEPEVSGRRRDWAQGLPTHLQPLRLRLFGLERQEGEPGLGRAGRVLGEQTLDVGLAGGVEFWQRGGAGGSCQEEGQLECRRGNLKAKAGPGTASGSGVGKGDLRASQKLCDPFSGSQRLWISFHPPMPCQE